MGCDLVSREGREKAPVLAKDLILTPTLEEHWLYPSYVHY